MLVRIQSRRLQSGWKKIDQRMYTYNAVGSLRNSGVLFGYSGAWVACSYVLIDPEMIDSFGVFCF